MSQGIEIAGQVPLSDRFALFGSYTYTDIETPDGERAVRVPEHDVVLGLNAMLTDRLNGTVTAQYVAGVVDSDFPDIVDLPDYTVVDATMSYALSDQTEAYVRVENVFDEEYQTILDFGTSDRALFVGLRASF